MTSGQEKEDTSDTCQPYTPGSTTIRTISFSGRWLFTLAVIGTAVISVFLFVVGFIIVFTTIADSLTPPHFDIHTLTEYMATFIKIIDIFLVATVFYIIALGFYESVYCKGPAPRVAEDL